MGDASWLSRTGVLLAGVLLALAALSACSSANSGAIVIYSSIPLQGSGAADNRSVVDAIKMALADHNGRAGPFTVKYISLDDSTAARGEWDPGQEAKNARTAVNDPNAVAVIGPLDSPAAKVSIPILNLASMAEISPSATYPGLTKTTAALPGEPYIYSPLGPDQRNFCRDFATDDVQGAAGALYAQQTLGAKSVFVLDDTQLYGHGIAGVFEQKAAALGIKVLGHLQTNPATKNFADPNQAQQIVSANPDLVYFGGLQENGASTILTELRTRGFKGVFMGPDGIDEQDFVDKAGNNAGSVIATLPGLPPDQLTGDGASWYSRYKQSHGGKEPGPYAAYGYDAMRVLLDAITKAATGSTPPSRGAVLAALRNEKNFAGITGTFSFDQNCDTTLTAISVLQVKNGAFAYVGPAPQP